jgi:tetratricopeptide (TPR) repeat protein
MNPLVQSLYASVFIHMGTYDSAMVYLDKALALDPDHHFANGGLIMAGHYLGQYERVLEGLGKMNIFSEAFIDSVKVVYRDQGYEIAYRKIIEQFDQLEIVQTVRKALWNGFINRYDIVLDLLEKGYEVHDPNMPYIASKGHGFYNSLSGDPRFVSLLEKMRLPLPEE